MKKLIMIAAVALCAAYANAASFSWGSDANFVDGDGKVLTASTAPAGDIVLVYLGAGATADWANAQVVDTATVNYASSMGTLSSKANTTFYFNYSANTAEYDVGDNVFGNGAIFGVMFQDDEGNLSNLMVGENEIKPTYTISGMDSDATALGKFTYSSTAYTAVPEPTSGLLMLVGLGALALRRRRA